MSEKIRFRLHVGERVCRIHRKADIEWATVEAVNRGWVSFRLEGSGELFKENGPYGWFDEPIDAVAYEIAQFGLYLFDEESEYMLQYFGGREAAFQRFIELACLYSKMKAA